jgi:putative ABC transport system substrate-binding protein
MSRFPDGLESGFALAAQAGAGAGAVAAALLRRLPTMFANKAYLQGDGLMSFGPDIVDSLRRMAVHVDKILKGAKPGDIPVEQPTTFHQAINLKAAKALNLTVPASLLARVTR